MKWYSGDIAAAINLARTRGSIFVVFVEGNDESSKQLGELINNEGISAKLESDAFVAIKIQSDKEEYLQFAKIYQLVPIPSIFFIKNGIPIKIVTGTVKTVTELGEAIESIIKSESTLLQPQTSSASPSAVQNPPPADTKLPSPTSDDSEIVCEGGVCYKKPSETEVTPKEAEPLAADNKPIETEEEKQEKIKKAMKLIEQKRIERIQEEQRLEKEKEIQRRKEGQEIINLKKWQEDQEMKQIKEERLKEKNEAKAARQRVLDQIEQDKKERAAKFANQQPTETKASPVTPPTATTPTSSNSNTARIQFKKPNGETEVVTFDSEMLFADLHLFVKNDVLQGVKDFVLATNFPRREFKEEDFKLTLKELNLTPSAVLLIIVGKKPSTFSSGPSTILPTQSDGSFFGMVSALFFGLLTPVVALFTYLKTFVFREPNQGGESANDAGKRKRNEDLLVANDAAKKRNLNAFNAPIPEPSTSTQSDTGAIPKSGAYKRPNPSNIHRLHQDSESDEDKKTYNGNSTQQL